MQKYKFFHYRKMFFVENCNYRKIFSAKICKNRKMFFAKNCNYRKMFISSTSKNEVLQFRFFFDTLAKSPIFFEF